MINLLLEILLIGLFCNGLYISAEEGMIFYEPAKWLKSKPDWLSKPIISCVYCMASFWGSLLHIPLGFIFGVSAFMLPVVIVSAVFMNGFIRLVYEVLLNNWKKQKRNEFDSKTDL